MSPGHNWNTCGYYVENNAGEKVRDEEKVGSVDFGIAVPAHNLEYDLIHRPQKQERELEKPRGRPPRPLLKTAVFLLYIILFDRINTYLLFF